MIIKKSKRSLLPCLTVIAIFFFLIFITPPANSGGSFVSDETCMDCHDSYDHSLKKTPHRLSSTVSKASVTIACVSCHGPGEAHADDPSVENIINPAALTGKDKLNGCISCHAGHNELDNYGFDPHQAMDMNCTSCHKVHSDNPGALLDSRSEFCAGCHTETKTRFIRRSNHPTLSNNVSCLSCHSFTKRSDEAFAYDLNKICQDCHSDFAGPFLYEHEATNAYSVDGDGCIGCHEPHGSENSHLLKMPTRQLCQQCHAVPGHAIAHASAYSSFDCSDCHSEIHGSHTNSYFLDPNLPAQIGRDCYQSGCHSQTN